MTQPFLPDVAVSKDGQRALLVLALDPQTYDVPNKAAIARMAKVRLRPRSRPTSIRLPISHAFRVYWSNEGQQYRWHDLSFDEALPALSVLAIGQHLDTAPIPQQPQGRVVADVWVVSDLMELWGRDPEEDDARILRYVAGKFFWGFKLGLEEVRLQRHDALRFGVEVEDLHILARQSEGVLWKRTPEGYKPEPRLLTDFRAGALPGLERPRIEGAADLLDAGRYPGAAHHLSRAREFIHAASPDFPNAAKEAVNAVESVCKTILNAPNATLGDCIKTLRRERVVPGEVARILESLYAYRNSTPGVGHGAVDLPEVRVEEATLILGVAAEGITYLDALSPRVDEVPRWE